MTDSYSLVVKKSAERELRAILKTDLLRITARLRGLTSHPQPPRLKSSPGMITIAFAKETTAWSMPLTMKLRGYAREGGWVTGGTFTYSHVPISAAQRSSHHFLH